MKKLSLESNALLEQIQCIKSIEGPMWLGLFSRSVKAPKGRWPQMARKERRCLGGKGGVADGIRTHDNRNHNPGLYH